MKTGLQDYLDLSPYFPVSGFRAAISLKRFPFSPPADRLKLAEFLGLSPTGLVLPRQVHSTSVRVVTNPGQIDKTDGIITSRNGLVLSIQVADCIPLFIIEPDSRTIGLIHAGWRGITDGIVRQMLRVLLLQGIPLDKAYFLLGPSILKCCFEVGPDVVDRFDPSFIQTRDQDRSLVDLQGIVTDQLLDAGARPEKIIDIKQCTKCTNGKYHSYRRDGDLAGRMTAVMGWCKKL